jgi:hypothetical protein
MYATNLLKPAWSISEPGEHFASLSPSFPAAALESSVTLVAEEPHPEGDKPDRTPGVPLGWVPDGANFADAAGVIKVRTGGGMPAAEKNLNQFHYYNLSYLRMLVPKALRRLLLLAATRPDFSDSTTSVDCLPASSYS